MKVSAIRHLIEKNTAGRAMRTLLESSVFWSSDKKIWVLAANFFRKKAKPKFAVILIKEIFRKNLSLSTKVKLDLLYVLGDCYYDLTLYKKSVAVYGRIIRAKPCDIAFNNRATAFWAMEDYASSLLDYQAAASMNPMNYTALFGAGDALIQFSKFDMALNFLKAAIKINPCYARAYTALGAVYFKIADFEKSKKYLQKALELDPTEEKAQDGLQRIAILLKTGS